MFFFVLSQAMSNQTRNVSPEILPRGPRRSFGPGECSFGFPGAETLREALAVVDGNADAQNTLQTFRAGNTRSRMKSRVTWSLRTPIPRCRPRRSTSLAPVRVQRLSSRMHRAGMTAFFQLLAAIRRSRCKASKFLEGWLRTAASLERVRHWEAAC